MEQKREWARGGMLEDQNCWIWWTLSLSTLYFCKEIKSAQFVKSHLISVLVGHAEMGSEEKVVIKVENTLLLILVRTVAQATARTTAPGNPRRQHRTACKAAVLNTVQSMSWRGGLAFL